MAYSPKSAGRSCSDLNEFARHHGLLKMTHSIKSANSMLLTLPSWYCVRVFFLPYEITLHFFFLRKMQRGPDTLTSPVDIHIWFVFKLYTFSFSSWPLKTKPKEKNIWVLVSFSNGKDEMSSLPSICHFSHYFKLHTMFKFIWYFISINVKR